MKFTVLKSKSMQMGGGSVLKIAVLLSVAALFYSCPTDGDGTSVPPIPPVPIAEEIQEKDPAIIYKADMQENAQSLFNKGDIDNPYLFTFGVTSIHLIEDLRGELTITGDTDNDGELEELYNENIPLHSFVASHRTLIKNSAILSKMYVMDNDVLMNIRKGTAVNAIPPVYKENDYIVGIGLTETDVIDFDILPTDITLRVRIFYDGEDEKPKDEEPEGEEPERELLKKGALLKEETVQVSKANPYKIYTWRDLQHMNDDLEGHYTLQNDIIFPEVGDYGYENFAPIGNTMEEDIIVTVDYDGFPHTTHRAGKEELRDIDLGQYNAWRNGTALFRGSLEGNNHKIEGLYIHYPTKDLVGLFRVVRGRGGNTGDWEGDIISTIQNLTIYHVGITGRTGVGGLIGHAKIQTAVSNVHVYALRNAKVKSTSTYSHAGGLIGIASGWIWNNFIYYVKDSSAHTDVEGKHYVGGLIGWTNEVSVYNSYTTGNVIGKNRVGGLIGYIDDYSVRSITEKTVNGYVSGYTTGDITGENDVGGLIGHAERGVFYGYSTGNVEGTSNVGGVIGSIRWDRSYYNNLQDLIVRAYSVGDVTGNERVGGVVGYVNPFESFPRFFTNEKDQGKNVIVGYSRGRVRSGDTSAGLLVGEVYHTQKYDVQGYVSASTSGFLGITENQAEGIGGTRIDISDVTDENYQERFAGFTFSDTFGDWAWVGDGKWPAINIGDIISVEDQSIQASAASLSIPTRPQEKQKDTTLQGIEQLAENVFKVYETHSWKYEQSRIENRIPHADFYPTGLYIKPNKTITVTVTSDDTGLTNLELFAGTYSRYSNTPDPYKVTLQKGENIITNPHNKPRLIYIRFVSDRYRLGKSATVTIAGATKTPYFIHGKTKNEEFKTMLRDYDYDSILIVSDRIMSVASKDTALQVLNQDWEKTAELLDKVVKISEDIYGLDGESYFDHPPTTRILAVEYDANEGSMHATNHRVVVPKWGAAEWLDNTKIVKSWGLWHEVGHMYESSQVAISETTVNIYSLAVERAFNQKSRLVRENRWDDVEKYLAQPQEEFSNISVFTKLGMLQQLWLGYGSTDEERDKFFIKLGKKIRQESEPIRTPKESLAYLAVKASEVYGYNLNDFFKKWGLLDKNKEVESAFATVDNLNLKQPPIDLTTLRGR